jgi:biotin synthase
MQATLRTAPPIPFSQVTFMLDFDQVAQSALSSQTPSREVAIAMLKTPDSDFPALFNAAWKVRHHFHGKRMNVQVLSNAKSGLCPEDCHYCSQSKVSDSEIARYPLKDVALLVEEAKAARDTKANHFCMGLSGRSVKDKEVDALCDAIRTIKKEVGIEVCCALGFMNLDQARRLREAGLDRVNHNLNTSERHYPSICTTHTYGDRLQNLMVCQEAGLEICSGGIVGQGESDEDIVDMLMALQTVNPKSVPINFLIPVDGTPFARMKHKLTPIRCLKVLAVARLLHPTAELRVAGGREYHLRTLQPMALFLVNSLFVSGYLTEGGQAPDETMRMIEDAGFEVGAEETISAQA